MRVGIPTLFCCIDPVVGLAEDDASSSRAVRKPFARIKSNRASILGDLILILFPDSWHFCGHIRGIGVVRWAS
jgi:hypothetical protein